MTGDKRTTNGFYQARANETGAFSGAGIRHTGFAASVDFIARDFGNPYTEDGRQNIGSVDGGNFRTLEQAQSAAETMRERYQAHLDATGSRLDLEERDARNAAAVERAAARRAAQVSP